MRGILLDSVQEGFGKCFLVKMQLRDYILSLPYDYREYEIQREIVSNAYLDDLINTILHEKHIPLLVLVVDPGDFLLTDNELTITNFKILDGLQRTFRLKLIYETIQLFLQEYDLNPGVLNMSKIQISKQFKIELEKIGGSSNFSRVIDFANKYPEQIQKLRNVFNRNQWFEIWAGLDEKAEVGKMLVLNAGHKPVKTKHQLELLFRNIIPILQKHNYPQFIIRRERDISSTMFSKTREIGQFHFSSLITAILSFGEGKPLTSNIDLIQKRQSDYFSDKIFDELLAYDFLDEFVKTLLKLDQILFDYYGRVGTMWFGRETSLVGLFAAAGKIALEDQDDVPRNSLILLREKISLSPEKLSLEEFERVRNSQNLAKINIGTINKRAVFEGVYNILKIDSDIIHWNIYFKSIEQ